MKSHHYERLFTGYTDLNVKGNWVLHETEKKLKWDNWQPGEPNNWGGDEHCVVMYYDTLKLNDDSCTKKRLVQVCNVNEVSEPSPSPLQSIQVSCSNYFPDLSITRSL